ncbi:hypothetical protein BS50DRAFT_217293 [Corynespora cassiicola Philippines]|uniref:Uncharacterized protein n=1 Tax=Corynespora cassiicola Philippines TaxID=1448308 RepID=A0A2T2N3J0_CORCC|nr:hypothetical protein BS50DRAFT_217293 [Corynespora cassiicola Philippines]
MARSHAGGLGCLGPLAVFLPSTSSRPLPCHDLTIPHAVLLGFLRKTFDAAFEGDSKAGRTRLGQRIGLLGGRRKEPGQLRLRRQGRASLNCCVRHRRPWFTPSFALQRLISLAGGGRWTGWWTGWWMGGAQGLARRAHAWHTWAFR